MPFSRNIDKLISATSTLLVQGGDTRIVLDAVTGLNKYGCPACPDPDVIALGSATASIISPPAYAAVDKLRDVLCGYAETEPHTVIYARELDRVRTELIAFYRLEDMVGLEIVFAASGTDSHLIAAQLVRNQGPMCALMVDVAETGRGVPAALAGRHFSTRTALASEVDENGAIVGQFIEVVEIASRLADGALRPVEEMDAEIIARTQMAIGANQRVLLTLVDVSKTGRIIPGVACVTALHQRFPQQVDVLVDACQLRMAPSTLRTYLQQGCMVAITGSKFMTGPTFSGALLIPSSVSARLQHYPVPASLRAYSSPGEWSHRWDTHLLNADAVNYGLLLRWQAALVEMRRFYALPEREISRFLQTFADAIYQKLSSDPVFELLPVPLLDRGPLMSNANWDRLPTIFPFLLRVGHKPDRLLSCDEMLHVYQLLQHDLSSELPAQQATSTALLASRVQLGQPVICASRNDTAVSALRLCISARLIAEALSAQGQGESAVIARALGALDKVALLLRLNLA